MDHIERLAREICWAEFTVPAKKLGTTKTKYWLGVHPDKKAEYARQAKWLLWASKHPRIEKFLADYF